MRPALQRFYRPRVSSRATWAVALVLASLALGGCRHPMPPAIPAAGHSGFTFVKPWAPPVRPDLTTDESPQLTSEPSEELVDAEPIEPLAVPAYPPTALAAHAGWATVGVRITVDPQGRVADMAASPVCFSTPGPYATAFRAAAESALAQWRFVPAELRHIEPYRGLSGKMWRIVARSEKMAATLDVLFTFTATGEVLTSPAADSSRGGLSPPSTTAP